MSEFGDASETIITNKVDDMIADGNYMQALKTLHPELYAHI